MINCQICHLHAITSLVTKCCKRFICSPCKEMIDQKLACFCNKPAMNKKIYHQNIEIYQLLTNYNSSKTEECNRCEQQALYECQNCQKLFCEGCNNEMHDGLGYSAHKRIKCNQASQKINIQEKLRRKDFICQIHSQKIINGCECGMGLCNICLKNHKEICLKGGKFKNLKEFKVDYFQNIDFQMRQISLFKEKLTTDRKKYEEHFLNEKASFLIFSKSTNDQLQYLLKIIETKIRQINLKMSQYWENCEKIYRQNEQKIKQKLINFDEYAILFERFARTGLNTEYLEEKVERFYPNFEFIHQKHLNTDQIIHSLSTLEVELNPWCHLEGKNIAEAVEEQNLMKDDHKWLFKSNLQDNAEIFVDISQNPLKARKLHLISSHSSIFYSFLHLPFQNQQYEIQYGVGIKMKGLQVFKKVTNKTGYGIIEGLNSLTKYRFKMKVKAGDWSDIVEMTTLSHPTFDAKNNQIFKNLNENSFLFLKNGIVYGSNEISFGVHKWAIKILAKTSNNYEQSETACISVGVSSKQIKKTSFVGSTFNYGYQKEEIVLKIVLDCTNKKLIIESVNKKEVFQNLPSFPIFPSIQNKGNSQVLIKYSLMNDDKNLC